MLMIRLSRVGKKKYPTYRIVIQEKSRDPWSKALEILGNYNPHTKEFACKAERIKHWLSVGAQMSSTVNNLLIKHSIIEGKKMRAARLSKKKKKGEVEEKKEASKNATTDQKEERATTEVKPVEEIKEDKNEDKKEEAKKDKPKNKTKDKKEETKETKPEEERDETEKEK